jgi:hypothetical protein
MTYATINRQLRFLAFSFLPGDRGKAEGAMITAKKV